MRDPMQLIPIFVAVVIAIAVPLSLMIDESPEGSNSQGANVAIKGLQSLATAACQCEHYGNPGQPQDCWAAYKAATARYEITSAASACYPVSDEIDIVSSRGREIGSVSTGFRVVGLPLEVDPVLCSGDDAAAVASVGEKAFQQAGGDNAKNPKSAQAAQDKAFIDAVKTIQGGHRLASKVSGAGC